MSRRKRAMEKITRRKRRGLDPGGVHTNKYPAGTPGERERTRGQRQANRLAEEARLKAQRGTDGINSRKSDQGDNLGGYAGNNIQGTGINPYPLGGYLGDGFSSGGEGITRTSLHALMVYDGRAHIALIVGEKLPSYIGSSRFVEDFSSDERRMKAVVLDSVYSVRGGERCAESEDVGIVTTKEVRTDDFRIGKEVEVFYNYVGNDHAFHIAINPAFPKSGMLREDILRQIEADVPTKDGGKYDGPSESWGGSDKETGSRRGSGRRRGYRSGGRHIGGIANF